MRSYWAFFYSYEPFLCSYWAFFYSYGEKLRSYTPFLRSYWAFFYSYEPFFGKFVTKCIFYCDFSIPTHCVCVKIVRYKVFSNKPSVNLFTEEGSKGLND
uniref:hypothetical protein n=1 Tax=Ornithobacterium rhinotracheale TaxID=28251 RepID=UPI0039A4415E